MFLIPYFSFSQEIPFEEKAKYEKFLAQKVEDVIVKVLGPNQAKIVVETEMDFTKTEKVIYDKTEKKSLIMADKAGDVSGLEYLMPGFLSPSEKDDNKSYSKQLIFPSTFIKRIKVTALVNKKLEETLIVSIKNIILEVLNLNEKRGDEIVIVSSEFAPLWKNIWYNQESMSFIIKYIILSILGIISLIIVAIGFLKLAGAMNTMAKVQQSHQITMELGGTSTGLGPNLPTTAISSLEFKTPTQSKSEKEVNDEENKIYFNIKPYQIDALVSLMIKESPSNVSIVVNHLSENIRQEFLKRLPEDFRLEVIAGLSKIRFLEEDTILTLKDELETRLAGAVGGLQDVLLSMKNLSYLEKSSMIKAMKEKYPELAKELMDNLLLPEHIYLLDENELSILVSSASVDDWAIFYSKIDDNFKNILRSQFSPTAWKIIEEKNKYEKPSEELIESAISNLMSVFEKLIKEGRIKRPEYKLIDNIKNNEKLDSKRLIPGRLE